MNSSPPRSSSAALVSVVASSETPNLPPGDSPRPDDSSLEQAPNTNSVAAAPVAPVRNCRRVMPSRRALSSANRCVRRITSRRNGLCGTGWNSPFDTGPNLIGSQSPPPGRAPVSPIRPKSSGPSRPLGRRAEHLGPVPAVAVEPHADDRVVAVQDVVAVALGPHPCRHHVLGGALAGGDVLAQRGAAEAGGLRPVRGGRALEAGVGEVVVRRHVVAVPLRG